MKDLEKDFIENFGRNLGEKADQEILNEGNSECKHNRIFYIDNAFDGQAYWCDDCERHERMDYSPGFKMRFPQNALISTPNPGYWKEGVYSFKTDEKCIVHELKKDSWIERQN